MDIGASNLSDLLEALAARTPAPGGGAVAPVMAGLSAALATMVVKYSTGKERLQAHEPLYRDMLAMLAEYRAASLDLARDDAVAYANLNALQKLDASDPTRRRDWTGAVKAAIDAPRRTLELAISILDLCEQLVGRSNTWLRSDVAIAAITAEAAASTAGCNVRINLTLLDSDSERRSIEQDLDRQLARAREARLGVEEACR